MMSDILEPYMTPHLPNVRFYLIMSDFGPPQKKSDINDSLTVLKSSGQ